ncbi:hypothetical protein [Jannaschia formosa]|uniref:hypothetical protein n=1 Tax=Jannaschia formosa TaxID=2259592 RepID=UPI000E1C05FB|nr:hypothetical protein [Jannaschia formosa]
MFPPTHVPANLAPARRDAALKLGLMTAMAGLLFALAIGPGAEPDAPALLVVRHDVADLTAWRRAFDGALPLRREAGELAAHLVTDPRDQAAVTAVFLWRSAAEARAFASSDLLAEGMRRSGVASTPEIALIAGTGAERLTPLPAPVRVAAAD